MRPDEPRGPGQQVSVLGHLCCVTFALAAEKDLWEILQKGQKRKVIDRSSVVETVEAVEGKHSVERCKTLQESPRRLVKG